MLMLIAESKTMTPCDGMINECDYMSHRPALESDAIVLPNFRPAERGFKSRISRQCEPDSSLG